MFLGSHSKSTGRSSSLSGGMATFTPQRIAGSLSRNRDKAPAPPPAGGEPIPAVGQGDRTIHVDLGAAVRGAIAVVDFMRRRAADKRAARKDLERVALDLARAFKGFLGIPGLLAQTGCSRPEAETCLLRLEASSACRFLCHYQDEALYVFPAFLPRAWSCDYCASQFPVGHALASDATCACPNCGAAMGQKILV